MATAIQTQKQLYDIFLNALQDQAPDLTDTHEGSILDSLGGAFTLAAVENQKLLVDLFAKAFFDTAHGPEVTGGADDLQTLAVDHYGAAFARPAAVAAIGTVTFSRPTSGAGPILIPAGTVVKTLPNAAGVVQRFATVLDTTIVGTSVNASVIAQVSGSAGNVAASTISIIESTLLDSTILVNNSAGMAGGAEALNDAEYREFIRNQVEVIRGATADAIKAKALTVSGVVTATPIETAEPVIPYDIATNAPVGGALWFRIPHVYLYIADANGTASAALILAVQNAIESVRACGVQIIVTGASPLVVAWTATITLNPSGPNYTELAANPQKIKDSMTNYINALPIGTGFVRADANAAILALWGAAGTNDLTAFTTSVPSGNVAATAVQKLIAGTMSIV